MKRHNEAMVDMLRNNPDFAVEYLRTAFEEMDQDGGEAALLTALHHVVRATGLSFAQLMHPV
jgi:DNA-binding phage protein